mgnify:CR=1 FL=1
MQTDTRIPCRTVPTRDEVLESVAQIVAEQIGAQADRIAEGNALVEDLGCDSLDIVEIAMELEEHFDISIPDRVWPATLEPSRRLSRGWQGAT